MSGELLQRAVAKVREVAAAATAPPWEARVDGSHPWVALYGNEDTVAASESLPSMESGGTATKADAQHIALWHPAVALAVADWLNTAAADLWAHGLCGCTKGCDACDDDLSMPHVRHALALARLLLGEEA